MNRTDGRLVCDRLSKPCIAWMDSWADGLGKLMKLNSHEGIQAILDKALEEGVGVDEVSRRIVESGIRDERYNNRRSVQSAFRLHDLYVAYTTDYNRATAQTAMEVTEEQVFQPERKSLAWAINNRLLNEYNFKYVEAYFEDPDITNADDIMKLMTAANNAGGLTPNKAKDILYKALG